MAEARFAADARSGALGAFLIELAILRRLLAARLHGQLQYKTSFALQVAGNGLIHIGEMVTIFFLFDSFGTLGGWTKGEVAFLYGMSSLSFGVAHIVGAGLSAFPELIRRGEFDRVLTRPLGAFLQVLGTDLQLRRIGGIIQGVVVLTIGLRLTDVDWTVGRVLWLLVALICAMALFVALFSLEATLCFWTTQGIEVINAVTYGGSYVAIYPLHIFDTWLRRLFLWIVPLGFVIYTPALYLLDKPTPLDLPAWTRFIAPLTTLLFWLAALQLWRLGVRRYQSSGS